MEWLVFLAGCIIAVETVRTTDPTLDLMLNRSDKTFNKTNLPPDIDEQLDRMPTEIRIPSVIGVTILGLICFMGNFLTICSFIKDVQLRSNYDLYIVNLAVTDLCIACISIPVYATYSLSVEWPFGRLVCKAWLAADFTFCLETVLMIIIISLDRLLYIRLGIEYTTRITPRLAKLQIIASWVFAFLLYSPAIIWWDVWVGYSTVKETECHVEFAYDFWFTSITALAEFIIPALALVLINGAIYKDVRMLVRRRRKVAPDVNLSSICASAEPSGSGCRAQHWSHKPRKANGMLTLSFRHRNSYDLHNLRETQSFEIDNMERRLRLSSLPVNIRNGHFGDSWCERNSGDALKSRTQTNTFLKAARSLTLLVIMFIICWSPYTILTVVLSVCGRSCVNPILYEFFYWWLWIKSAMNPFLYAYSNSKYRSNFHWFLTCLCKRNT